MRRIAGRDRERLHLGVEDAARFDLVPVVILGVDPEHGDRGYAMLGANLLGQSNGRQRLQQREERPTEQTGLLPGDDGHGLRVPKSGSCRDRCIGSTAAALLSLHEIRDRLAWTSVPLSACDDVAPRRRIVGIASKEVSDARMVEDIVGSQATNPRESSDIDGKPGARCRIPAACSLVGVCLGRQT
jgi:hypothetical protein